MKKLFFIFIICAGFFARGETQVRIGLFYEVGKKTEKYLFKQETKVTITDPVNRSSVSTIWDDQGQELMRETAEIKNGLVVSQVMEQLQIKEKYVLKVENNKATFETFSTQIPEKPKLLETKTVKIGAQFYTGPSLEVLLLKNLDNLQSAKKIKFDFGIFELQKAISFDVKKTEKQFTGEQQLIPLKMELSSLLSLFVDSLYLEVDPDTGMLRRYRGRTPVRIAKNGRLEPFDGDIYYELKK